MVDHFSWRRIRNNHRDRFHKAATGERAPASETQADFKGATNPAQLTGTQQLQLLIMHLLQNKNQGTDPSAHDLNILAAIFGMDGGDDVSDWLNDAANGRLGNALTALFERSSSGVNYERLGQDALARPHIYQRQTRPDPTTPSPEYANTAGLLALIRDAEHSRTGDTVYNTAFGNRTVDFTNMTINEVLQWQLENNPEGPGTAAAGAYQIIRPTMEMLVTRMGLTGNELFDKNMQDRMAIELLKIRGLGRATHTQFAHNLSREWASLPRDAGGRSYYDGDGINSCHMAWDTVIATVENMSSPDQPAPTTHPTSTA